MNNTTKTIQETAMLVSLTVRKWSGRVSDKAAAKDIATANGAQGDVVKVTKSLVFDQVLDHVTKLEGEARRELYSLTLPWQDDGRRLLSAKAYMKLTQKMAVHKAKFDKLADDVAGKYEIMKDEARVRLAGLFNENDYPESIRGSYSFEVRIEPVANVDDIRVGLGEGERQKIADQLKSQIEASQVMAKRDIYMRAQKAVSHMAEKLAGFDPSKDGKDRGTFRDSIVTNVEELVGVLDDLNFDDDGSISALGDQLKKLTSAPAEELRTDAVKRAEASKTADEIMDIMKGYCG
jgi:hypothetical protein